MIPEDYKSPFSQFPDAFMDGMSAEDVKKLHSLFDQENLEELQMIRRLANAKYNFSTGFGHINVYNEDNYRNGTLHALERTRRELGCETMAQVIDYYYILGYSLKRIVYACFEAGFTNFIVRDVVNHLNRFKSRLKEQRQKLMEELVAAKGEVFQQMRGRVMAAEKISAEIALEKIKEMQDALRLISPVEQPTKYNRLSGMIDREQAKLNKVNGIDQARDIQVHNTKARHDAYLGHKIKSGWLDEALKAEAEKESQANQALRDVGPESNKAGRVVIID